MMNSKTPMQALQLEYDAVLRSTHRGQVISFASVATQYLCMALGRNLPPAGLVW